MLANLRNMALDMNAEIRDQNEQMDRIAEKVEPLIDKDTETETKTQRQRHRDKDTETKTKTRHLRRWNIDKDKTFLKRHKPVNITRNWIVKIQAASDQGQVARANQAAAEILKQWKSKKQSILREGTLGCSLL